MSSELVTSPTTQASASWMNTRNTGNIVWANALRLCNARNLRMVLLTVVFSMLMLAFIWYFSILVFTKPQRAHKESFAYSYFISHFVKELPAFKPLEDSQQFYFNIITGTDTPVNIMRYESIAPADEIISYYRLYFEILDFTFIKHLFDSEAMAIFRNTREEFVLYVDVDENSNTVTIENVKR